MTYFNDQKIPKTTNQFITDLKSGVNEEVRQLAAKELGHRKRVSDIPYLVEGLRDDSQLVADACAEALVKIGDAAVAETIAPLLASENVRLRNHVSEVLNLLGEPAVPTLIRYLESDDRDVRMFAVDNLVCISSPSSVKAFVQALEDNDINIAASAAYGLGRVGDESHVSVLEKHINDDIWMKCAVLRGMGLLGGARATKLIVSETGNEDVMVRISAIQALMYIADLSVLPELLSFLKKEPTDLLGNEIVAVFHRLVQDYSHEDFSNLVDRSLITALLELCKQNSGPERLKAIELLGNLKVEKAIVPLIELVSEDVPEIREAVIRSIENTGFTNLAPLVSLLTSSDSTFEQKCVAIECVGRFSTKESYGVVHNQLNTKGKTLSEVVLDIIGAESGTVPIDEIITLLQSEIKEIRVCAAVIIGQLKERSLINALVERLEGEEPEVQRAINNALDQIGR